MFKKLGTIEKTRRTFFGSEGQSSFIGMPRGVRWPIPNQGQFQNSRALFKVI